MKKKLTVVDICTYIAALILILMLAGTVWYFSSFSSNTNVEYESLPRQAGRAFGEMKQEFIEGMKDAKTVQENQ